MNSDEIRGEEGLYQWPCKRCRKPFTPKRMLLFPDKRFQTCCDDCQTLNLLEMIFSEDNQEEKQP